MIGGLLSLGGLLSSYVSGLRVYAPIGAWLAVGVSLVDWLATGRADMAPVVGLVTGLGALLIAGMTALRATAKTANRSRYQTLKDWIENLAMAQAGSTTDPRLKAQRDLLSESKGSHWITGEGYINVSRSLAEVEVSLMGKTSVNNLLEEAQFDKMRLTGSSVDGRDALLDLLNTAINDLRTSMSQVSSVAADTIMPSLANDKDQPHDGS